MSTVTDVGTGEQAVVDALRRAGARFAYVFGSRAGGDPRPDSDLDVAAWFGDDAPASWTVDLPGRGVDLLVLDSAPLYLAGRVALRGRLLFEDDAASRVRWESQTRTVYLDELPYLEQMTDGYLQALGDRGRR
ncbi:MAG: nucleotidyltransferase domain-containing protein [Sporichthyaceae bacterium]|nr:nucleotidyltransferase domain-containing protein [Sporichthyaceae bacterium]